MRYKVEFDEYVYWVIDTTIEDGLPCNVVGALTKKEAEAECNRLNEEDSNECDHHDHDHGVCLYCGKDIMDDLVAAAEYAAEGDR